MNRHRDAKGGATEMAEVEERIARLQYLLSSPDDVECDRAVLTHTLRNLEQLRAEMLSTSVADA